MNNEEIMIRKLQLNSLYGMMLNPNLIKISPSIVNHRIVGYYFFYKIPVPRGIKRKGESTEYEVLIKGVPLKYLEKYWRRHKAEIDKYMKEKYYL